MGVLADKFIDLQKRDPALAERAYKEMSDAQRQALKEDLAASKGLRQHAPAYSTMENPIPKNPYVSFKDRAGVKNLGNATSLKSLEKKTGMKFGRNSKGDVVYQKEGDPNFYTLDPPETEWEDVTDVGSDVVQGVGELAAQSLATAGVGLATKNPAAALTAGVLAAGTTGAGIDYARQKLGEALGYNEGVDPWSVGLTGLVGALGSTLPGNPLTKGQTRKFMEAGLNPEAFARPIATARQNFTDDFFHRVGAPTPEVMQQGRAKMKDVVTLEKKFDKKPLHQETKAFKQDLEGSLSALEQETWQGIQRTLAESDTPVDLTEPRNLLTDWISALQKKRKKTGLSGPEAEELARLQDLRNKHFFLEREVSVPADMTGNPDIPMPGGPPTPATELAPRFNNNAPARARDVKTLNDELKAYVDYAKSEKGMSDPAAQRMSVRVKKLREAITGSIEKSVPEMAALTDQYRKLQRHRENLYDSGFVDQGARTVEDYVPAAEGQLSETFTKRDKQALTKLRKGNDESAKDTIEQIDAFLKTSNNPNLPEGVKEVPFAARAETIEASNNWMKQKKAGIKGAGAAPHARLLTGMVLPSGIAGGGLGTLVGEGPEAAILGALGGVTFGYGANKALSPVGQRALIRSTQRMRDLEDIIAPLPAAAKFGTLNHFNPWQGLNNGGEQ